MSGISTHVLDTSRGGPAQGVEVVLEAAGPQGAWREMGRETTDADGRCRDLLGGEPAAGGDYRLRFETGAYFERQGTPAFHPRIEVTFTVTDPARGHHVPLLLSPFGYTTYRGS